MNDLIRLLHQLAQHRHLLGHTAARLQLPFTGYDGQMLQPPLFVGRIVGIRLGLLQQMADAPAHHLIATTADQPLLFLLWTGQNSGNGTGKTGFFGDVELHGDSGLRNKTPRVRDPG